MGFLFFIGRSTKLYICHLTSQLFFSYLLIFRFKGCRRVFKTVPASQLAVSVRNPEKAEGLRARGLEVRHGDFDQPETLDSAFSGINRLLIISTVGEPNIRH